ncbi:MAG: hypothetical protein H0W83_17430 [Planctomycetes bacterium]|nr:hypothetical protein [Planctomycetota bacterium]
MMSIFGWSFPFGRLAGVTMRFNWTLLVVVVFGVVGFVRGGRVDLVWIPILVPIASIFIHAFAHILMARITGGRANATVLWAYGDNTAFDLPFRAGNHFAVGISGPFASMVLWLIAELIARSSFAGWDAHQWLAQPGSGVDSPRGMPAPGIVAILAGSASAFNFQVMLMNLIPSILFDGGRIWRAVLWPMLGLRRAVHTTIIMGFIASFAITGLSIWAMDYLLLIFGLFLLIASFSEHRAFVGGYDVVFDAEPGYAEQRSRKPSFLARWRQRRREAREQHVAEEQAREQEILDRLLAKVSEHGLPSLTAAERDTLQAISRRQKERVQDRA